MAKFETNFHREPTGNKLEKGKDCIVKIRGDNDEIPTFATGLLYRRGPFGQTTLIQIEQTGRRSNPWKDIVKFEMQNPDGSDMEGDYRIWIKSNYVGVKPNKDGHTQYERDFGDNFEIDVHA